MSYLVKEVDSKDVFFFKKVLRKKNKSRVIYSVDDKSSSIYKDMEKSISKRFICEMSKKENFLIKKYHMPTIREGRLIKTQKLISHSILHYLWISEITSHR